MEPKFSEMSKVLVRYPSGPLEGYVVAIDNDNGRWIYEISHPDNEPDKSWENWAPEEWLDEAG